MNIRSIVFGATLVAGATLVSTVASAQAPTDADVTISSTTVQFNRAEASTAAGAQGLYGSLSRAASRVCVDSSERLQDAGYEHCRDAALAQAVAHVDIAALSAVYARSAHEGARRGSVTVGG